jgi:hypothetical protein
MTTLAAVIPAIIAEMANITLVRIDSVMATLLSCLLNSPYWTVF